MRRLAWLCLTIVVAATACDQMERWGTQDAQMDARGISLALDAPGTLDWGEEGTIRLTLENHRETALAGVRVELFIPEWLEFGRVDPPGTEVTLVGQTGEGTKFSYRIDDPPLEAGERRSVAQRIRVPPAEARGADPDTLSPPPPADRLLRARLVSDDGEVLGAEVRTGLDFRGAAPVTQADLEEGAGRSEQVRIQRDRVGPVQLGMRESDLRRAVRTARDTTWTAEGMRETGLLVPVGPATVVALISDDRVDRIIVRDRAVRTPEGLGVGSRMSELREAYGTACAGEAEGRLAVWFRNAPAISFGLNVDGSQAVELAAAPTRIPAAAVVREVWIRSGAADC